MSVVFAHASIFKCIWKSKKIKRSGSQIPWKIAHKKSGFEDWRREKSSDHKREQCCGVLLKIEKSYAAATKDLNIFIY